MATDIAFAVGVLALLGDRVPPALKVSAAGPGHRRRHRRHRRHRHLLHRRPPAGWALGRPRRLVARLRPPTGCGVRYVARVRGIGVAVWLATFESGVHATIAGVAFGLLCPARPLHGGARRRPPSPTSSARTARVTAGEIRAVSFRLRESVRRRAAPGPAASVDELLRDPGVRPGQRRRRISIGPIAEAAGGSSVSAGIAVGLVIGKFVGITGAVVLAVGRTSLGYRMASDAPGARDGRPRGHRLHGLVVHRRPRFR